MKKERHPCDIAFMQLNGGKLYVFNQTSKGNCRDCDEYSDELVAYRYEPSILLCEGCLEDRMSEDNK